MDRVVSITEARATLPDLLIEATEREVFILRRNKAVGVLLDPAKYEALLDRIEDLEDALAIATASPEGAIPWAPEEHAAAVRSGSGPDRRRTESVSGRGGGG